MMFKLLIVLLAAVIVCHANPTGRVVGGNDGKTTQYPYQISLRRLHSHTCGGSIIDKKWILTAAHCVVMDMDVPVAFPAKDFTVLVGTHNRIAGGEIIQVKRVIVNQEFKNLRNDLALLELEKELKYSSKVQPIDLAEEEVPAGSDVIISGWGLTEHKGDSLPIILQWQRLTAISKSQCATKVLMYTDSILCLDHPSGTGACNGDSGGPAVYDGKLVGVAGFVVGRCGGSRPDGYAKVSYNVDWIRTNMEEKH